MVKQKKQSKSKFPVRKRVRCTLPHCFPVGTDVKNMPANAGNAGEVCSIPGSGRTPGEGNGDPLQYSCLEIPCTVEPGGLQSMGSQRVRHGWVSTPTSFPAAIWSTWKRCPNAVGSLSVALLMVPIHYTVKPLRKQFEQFPMINIKISTLTKLIAIK